MSIGCDFRPRFQQISFLLEETGEYGQRRLMHTAEVERRKDLLALLDWLEEQIAPLNKAVSQAAASSAEACLLMTHPGVGPVVSLAYVLTIGNWQRFARGRQVGSHLGHAA